VARTAAANDEGEAALVRAADELVRRRAPARAALLGSSPRLRPALEGWLTGRGLVARVLGEDLPAPIPLDVATPERVGPDRVADAVWAARAYPGRAVLVVDLGTAITLNVVSPGGALLGGAIGPGLRMQAWALAERTARLPLVEVRGSGDETPLIGKDTQGSIRAALRWGAVGLVTTYAAEVERALGVRPVVVATGGDAASIAAACPRIERVVPDLTLLGLHAALLAAAGPP
jgi:type III pantothenate kinase